MIAQLLFDFENRGLVERTVPLSGGMYTLSGILVLLTLWGLKVGKQAAQKTETTVGDKQAVGIQVSE